MTGFLHGDNEGWVFGPDDDESPACVCGHERHEHSDDDGPCLDEGCDCNGYVGDDDAPSWRNDGEHGGDRDDD